MRSPRRALSVCTVGLAVATLAGGWSASHAPGAPGTAVGTATGRSPAARVAAASRAGWRDDWAPRSAGKAALANAPEASRFGGSTGQAQTSSQLARQTHARASADRDTRPAPAPVPSPAAPDPSLFWPVLDRPTRERGWLTVHVTGRDPLGDRELVLWWITDERPEPLARTRSRPDNRFDFGHVPLPDGGHRLVVTPAGEDPLARWPVAVEPALTRPRTRTLADG